MSLSAKSIINQALELSISDRVAMAEQLLASLASPDSELDSYWKDEAESRLEAYEKGDIASSSLEQVFAKYTK